MELPLLRDIIIILGLSSIILYISHRLRVPAIVSFLLTGVVAGPYGLGLISAPQEVESLADIGIVLLLFTIGMEFSLKSLLQIKRSVLMGGTLQVLLTFLAGFAFASEFGLPFGQSVFMGFLVSLSSTAIVLKLIQERAEIDSPHGRMTLGILIFQDIIIVPMIIAIPLLTGTAENTVDSLFSLLGKGVGIVLLVIVSAKWVVPYLLYQIARTRNRELFLLSIIVIGLSIAWLTSSIGLSLALGAFLAGLIISESEYSHQALGNVLPFRDVFTSFFFVSIGMLLDIGFLFRQPGFIILVALSVLVLKAITASSAVALLGSPLRTIILVGLALSQVGEFSFILSKTGVEHGLLSSDIYQLFLAVSVLTMAVTPFIMSLAPRIVDFSSRLPMPNKLKLGRNAIKEIRDVEKKDHLVIIGFGFNGKNLARTASATNIPYVVIEMNAEIVRAEREKGEPIYYGDATQEAVLKHADIKDARVAVVAISDPAATRRITEIARELNPHIYIIVRTRYFQELEALRKLGADEVIPEEFETSVEIFTRVLKKYLVPGYEIEKFVADVRSGEYEMLRSLSSKRSVSFSDFRLHLPDIEITSFRIGEKSPAAGSSLAQIDLRKRYGVSMLVIRRGSELIVNPHGETPLYAGDIVVVVGTRDKIAEAIILFLGQEA